MDFRLSRITEHNKNEETDHLYDPLRDTLRKSSVSKGKTLARVTSAHQLQGSKVSRVIRELSPEQANQMQREIWIPADKKLKPTDHMTRVAGKQFYAVDVQQRRGGTLTQEEFKRIYHGNQIQETVYQFGSSNNDSKRSSPFVTNQGFKFNSIQRGNSYNTNQFNGENRQTYVGFQQKRTLNSKNNEYTTGSQYGRVDSQKQSGSGVRFSRPGRLESGSNRDSRLNFQRESGSDRFNDQDGNRIVQPNLKGKAQSGQEKASENGRNSKYGRAKSTYKYNLFSSLDEAINTKCGSFGKNELIATKPQRPWG